MIRDLPDKQRKKDDVKDIVYKAIDEKITTPLDKGDKRVEKLEAEMAKLNDFCKNAANFQPPQPPPHCNLCNSSFRESPVIYPVPY